MTALFLTGRARRTHAIRSGRGLLASVLRQLAVLGRLASGLAGLVLELARALALDRLRVAAGASKAPGTRGDSSPLGCILARAVKARQNRLAASSTIHIVVHSQATVITLGGTGGSSKGALVTDIALEIIALGTGGPCRTLGASTVDTAAGGGALIEAWLADGMSSTSIAVGSAGVLLATVAVGALPVGGR